MAKNTENRYSGTDTVPWKVINAAGESPFTNKDGGMETFPGYKAANTEAQRYTREAGEFVSAVRT